VLLSGIGRPSVFVYGLVFLYLLLGIYLLIRWLFR